MISFKKFKKFKRTPEGHIILDEPIHFKNNMSTYRKDKEGHIILDEPIGQKNKLKEESDKSSDETAAAHEFNTKNHGSNADLSKKLHKATADNLSDHDKEHVHKYTGQDSRDPSRNGSYFLNKRLAKGEDAGPHKDMHHAIMKNAKASGHEHHVFSGTSRDFESIAKHSKGGIIHAPAHTSATHALHIARQFADNKFGDSEHAEKKHMIHIHVKPHDKILHTSHHSEYGSEHETVIPAGTKLKYSHSSDHHNDGDHYRVHHFKIHSQE